MKILIVGSGATGGLIGARLVEQKCNVTFLVRPERKAQLLTTGLMLYSHFGKFRRPVPAITVDELKGFYDLIIVAVRATDYASVLKSITPSIGPQTAVLPVIEGAEHLQVDLIQNGGRLFVGLLEARISIDADGCLNQRLPAAELSIGPADPSDAKDADRIASLLKGRGLVTRNCDRIQDRVWERYCFAAASVAVNVHTGLTLRDAIHPTHRVTILDLLITEGVNVGRAIGLSPDSMRARRYRENFRREGRPVQPPALVTDPGRGGCESAYLLLEMNCIAERAKVSVPRLRCRASINVRPASKPAAKKPAGTPPTSAKCCAASADHLRAIPLNMLIGLAGPLAERRLGRACSDDDPELAAEEAEFWDLLPDFAIEIGIPFNDDRTERQLQLRAMCGIRRIADTHSDLLRTAFR